MPKKTKELSATEVSRLTHAISKAGKPYNALHAVGKVPGLFLQVTPTSARTWILRIQIGSKRRDIGLGSYPGVTLAKARERAEEYREMVKRGIDPVEEHKEQRRALVAKQLATVTFASASEQFIARKAKEFKNPRQEEQWRNSLKDYAMPAIGNIPVAEIQLVHIKKVLDPIWEEKTETAKRVQGRIENILGWAATHGYRSVDNPAQWKGFLDKIYPAPAKIKKAKHHTALAVTDLPAFMQDLRNMKGDAAIALELLILTATRTNEVIGDKRIGKPGMSWEEIDFNKGIWTIPADRMKSGKEHRIPLCPRALDLLADKQATSTSPLVFTAPKGDLPSNNYLTAVLKRMDIPVTAHGFRSTFKDWAREYTAYADEVSELALAHVNSDATRAAYARSQLIDKRRRLMNEWESFCAGENQANSDGRITSIGAKLDA